MLMVPYLGGTAQALNDVIGGRDPLVIDGYPPLAGTSGANQGAGGRLNRRLPDFPDLATAAETLPGFNARAWFVLVAPVGTPDAIVQSDGCD